MEDVADESDYADDFNVNQIFDSLCDLALTCTQQTTGIIAERDKSKSYEVDFKVITAQTLVAKQTETIKSVHEMFAMSVSLEFHVFHLPIRPKSANVIYRCQIQANFCDITSGTWTDCPNDL